MGFTIKIKGLREGHTHIYELTYTTAGALSEKIPKLYETLFYDTNLHTVSYTELGQVLSELEIFLKGYVPPDDEIRQPFADPPSDDLIKLAAFNVRKAVQVAIKNKKDIEVD